MPSGPAAGASLPGRDCGLCPRLKSFRDANRRGYPDFHNAPVRPFGDPQARLLIVGLAPGLKGANRTGRPFTGDYAGDLLYATLEKFGFSKGRYGANPGDGLHLVDCRITNAVKCLPPENKPTGEEIRTCQPFLLSEIAALPRLQALLCLGGIAHGSVLTTLGLKKSAFKFAHGARHAPSGHPLVIDSYHCSRYNTNTGRLTTEMFEAVFRTIRNSLAD